MKTRFSTMLIFILFLVSAASCAHSSKDAARSREALPLIEMPSCSGVLEKDSLEAKTLASKIREVNKPELGKCDDKGRGGVLLMSDEKNPGDDDLYLVQLNCSGWFSSNYFNVAFRCNKKTKKFSPLFYSWNGCSGDGVGSLK